MVLYVRRRDERGSSAALSQDVGGMRKSPTHNTLQHVSGVGTSEEKFEDGDLQSIPKPVLEDNAAALVKSPPEPTRVKSPEQIIMRSPEPVNWTVPLDTGKTFTVTQNIHEVLQDVEVCSAAHLAPMQPVVHAC
uniref:Nuclear protein MDM1 n=1 Tax=Timema tahoe TaxID=61484 RepID=A0A7R9IJU6_9NEOP|nr:unnamed protein product [Timema tahoe]